MADIDKDFEELYQRQLVELQIQLDEQTIQYKQNRKSLLETGLKIATLSRDKEEIARFKTLMVELNKID